jgi:hypothetical protein
MHENEITSEFKEVELTKTQKFLAILGIILVILANTNPSLLAYTNYRNNNFQSAEKQTDLYFASLYTEGDFATLGIFNNFVRIK